MSVIEARAGQQFAFVWEHDGQRCPFVHFVDPKLVKSYADYCLIDEDLRQSRTCFELLLSGKISDHTVSKLFRHKKFRVESFQLREGAKRTIRF